MGSLELPVCFEFEEPDLQRFCLERDLEAVRVLAWLRS